jgi:hypothetical protein
MTGKTIIQTLEDTAMLKIRLRRKTAKALIVLCVVLAVSIIIAGTALAITSASGLSTCSPDSGPAGTATVVCTGLIASEYCGTGATLFFDLTAPAPWTMDYLDDAGYSFVNVSTYELRCGGNTPSVGCADDGRTNTNCSAPEFLYCSGDTLNFYLYDYATGKGTLDFSVKQSDLPESVRKETLVKQDGSVTLYMEPDGTFKLLAPQPDGKIYFMIFDASDCTSLREGAEWNLK